jgi:hypothetical protein
MIADIYIHSYNRIRDEQIRIGGGFAILKIRVAQSV